MWKIWVTVTFMFKYFYWQLIFNLVTTTIIVNSVKHQHLLFCNFLTTCSSSTVPRLHMLLEKPRRSIIVENLNVNTVNYIVVPEDVLQCSISVLLAHTSTTSFSLNSFPSQLKLSLFRFSNFRRSSYFLSIDQQQQRQQRALWILSSTLQGANTLNWSCKYFHFETKRNKI